MSTDRIVAICIGVVLAVVVLLIACGDLRLTNDGNAAPMPRDQTAGADKHNGKSTNLDRDEHGCKRGFTFKGGMCLPPYQPIDPDGPDPYRKVADCKSGDKHQVKVPLPDGRSGYRLVDQMCRTHPKE